MASFSNSTQTEFSGQVPGSHGETVQYPPRLARSQMRPVPHSALDEQASPTSCEQPAANTTRKSEQAGAKKRRTDTSQRDSRGE